MSCTCPSPMLPYIYQPGWRLEWSVAANTLCPGQTHEARRSKRSSPVARASKNDTLTFSVVARSRISPLKAYKRYPFIHGHVQTWMSTPLSCPCIEKSRTRTGKYVGMCIRVCFCSTEMPAMRSIHAYHHSACASLLALSKPPKSRLNALLRWALRTAALSNASF